MRQRTLQQAWQALARSLVIPVRRCAGLILLFFIAYAPPAYCASSRLNGTVFTLSASGERLYLPGTDVSLQCFDKPSDSRSTKTNDSGAFEFRGLTSGKCTATVARPGFTTVTRSLDLTEDETTSVDFELRLQTAKQNVDVTAAAPVIDVTETSPQAKIGQKALSDVPLAQEQIADAIPLVPGAVRGPDGLLNIKGAKSNQSGMVVNSANASDPVTGEQGFRLPIDVVESVQVVANPYGAEYGKIAGAVTKIQTLQGSDRYKVGVQNFFPRMRKRDGNIRGIEAATPRLTVTGPIVKSKAYFVQSFQYRYIRTRVPGLEHLDSVLRSDTEMESFDSHSQVDWDVSPSQHLSASVSIFPQKLRYANLNTFNPQETTPNWHGRGYLIAFSHRWILPSQTFLESEFSLEDQDADILPSTPGSTFTFEPGQNEGSYFNNQSRVSRRYQWQEILNIHPLHAAGEHLLKIGTDITHINFHGFSVSGDVDVRTSAGALLERTQFAGLGRLKESGTEFSFFVQDAWSPHKRVTISPGLRIDNDTLGEKWNLSPRLGFSVVLTSDNRTLLRGGAGLFFDKIPLNVRAFEQYQSRTITRFAADGSVLLPSTLFSNTLASDDFDNPRSWSWNAELDREVRTGLLLRLSYQQRQTSREFLVDAAREPAPAIWLRDRGRSLYREFGVTAKYQIGKVQAVASYTRSHSFGDLNYFNDYFGNIQSPLIRPNQRSLQNFDVPNRVLAWSDFNLPKDVIVSPVLDWRDGFPYSLVNGYYDWVGPRNRAGRFPRFLSLDVQATKGFVLSFKGKKYKARAGVRIFNLTDHFNPRDIYNNVSGNPITFRDECSSFGAFCNSVGRIVRGKLSLEF